ncbi:MATH domain and coiled-coil domain-containing protein At3g58210-like [Papaver somniferum]|uniref:MATH domain and coiled-coil domain-containing protein At3g58210-like n=1 Tax=Papaver somniferum TaxID=3469 RepID=UPI000E6FB48C|nr:MATH domain and coiled-coil domain-containing protein At3g58210-like [Papaver somniferum]
MPKALIDPKGNKEVYDHLSLFLCPIDLTKSVDTEYTFAVTSQTDSNNTVEKEATKRFPDIKHSGWGWRKFMPLSELHDPDKGYIVNDTCIIEVEVTCRMDEDSKDAYDSVNESDLNKVAHTENEKQSSPEYPGAGQPFGEGRHNNKVGFGKEEEFEDVGGFCILKTQAPLYRQIWLKYGHIPSAKVMPIASYPILVIVVKDLMCSITDMHKCHYVDLSSEMIDRWEDMITMAEKFEFNIGWLRERFEHVKKGMCQMQNENVKTELLEHGQHLRATKSKMRVLRNVMTKVEVQLIALKDDVREKISGLLSKSDTETYLEIGEDLLLDGLF